MVQTIDIKRLTTRGGVLLDVRRAVPEDEADLAAFFAQVSDEDRRFRFLCAAPEVRGEQLAALTHCDDVRTESYVGFDHATQALVASAVLACDAEGETAEIAVAIRHDYRARGVGWALLGMLSERARARGVKLVMSIESRDNHAAIELERERGFVPEPCDGDPTLVILSKTFR